MPPSSRHNAPGQMAGYSFQYERALYWLAESESGAKVGIETEDDITKHARNGMLMREQDKSSISSKIPFGDKSKDLWNTLKIWIEAINLGEVDILKTEFYLVTNKILPDCIVKRIGMIKKDEDVIKIINQLRLIGESPSDTIKPFVNYVLAYDDNFLAKLIKKIRVSDGSDCSFGNELKEKIIARLHIPSYLPAQEVLHYLLGWINDTTLQFWRDGKPAWITREAFDNQLDRIVSRLRKITFRERAKRLVPVSDEERESQFNTAFVKQLHLLECEEGELQDLIIDSIDDFLCCSIEISRLSQEGNITKDDFIEFKDRLLDRWNHIFNVKTIKYKKELRKLERKKSSLLELEELGKDIGMDILDETLMHKEILAGQCTEESYLTKGCYHKLSNNIDVGWHPKFSELLKKNEGKND